MSATDFFDTNILLYLASGDPRKAETTEMFLNTRGWISVQVLNEFVSVALRKFRLTFAETRDFLEGFRDLLDVTPLSGATHDRAMEIVERYRFDIYDATIVAAALQSGCDTLYTEDLHHGQKISGLTIRNPFTS